MGISRRGLARAALGLAAALHGRRPALARAGARRPSPRVARAMEGWPGGVLGVGDPPEYVLGHGCCPPLSLHLSPEERARRFREAISASLRSDPDVFVRRGFAGPRMQALADRARTAVRDLFRGTGVAPLPRTARPLLPVPGAFPRAAGGAPFPAVALAGPERPAPPLRLAVGQEAEDRTEAPAGAVAGGQPA